MQALTSYAPDTPLLDRYRNEVAADTLGVAESEIDSAGLLILRRLAATAPDADSDIPFLPQPRAINLMKACQEWILSEEGISDEVQSQLTFLFLHVAPILQNVSGSHWDLIFDISENNLEVDFLSLFSSLLFTFMIG